MREWSRVKQGWPFILQDRQCERTDEENMEMRLWDGAAVASFLPFSQSVSQSGSSVMCRVVLGTEMKAERDHRLALSLKKTSEG